MPIAKIFGQDFKGLKFEQELSHLNLFIGPNGVGKSARCNALMLAVMGYIPGVAKQNAEGPRYFWKRREAFLRR